MTIHQIKSFFALYYANNFAKAEEKLEITHEELLENIAAIEKEVDRTLFDYSGKRPMPTPDGDIFFREAIYTINAWEQMEKNLFDKHNFGKVYPMAVSKSLLPDGLTRFYDKIYYYEMREHIHLDIDELPNDEVLPGVISGKYSCGIIMEKDPNGELNRQEIVPGSAFYCYPDAVKVICELGKFLNDKYNI